MASLEFKKDTYYCQFCYLGKRHTVTVGKVPVSEAKDFCGATQLLLLRLKQRLVSLPPGVGIGAFVLAGGQVTTPVAPPKEDVSFSTFKENYLETHRNGALEANSLKTVEMHLNHLQRTLGKTFSMGSLTLRDLQRHIDQRRKKEYHGRKLSPATLKKEIASFRAAWNWAARMGIVEGVFPCRGLVYPKSDEKPSFMTKAEIEQRPEAQRKELWGCLYLTKEEVEKLLVDVQKSAEHPWIYPMFCFAGHTGARRSEMLRAVVTDVNFNDSTVLIHEKKRSHKQRTTRRVPLTPFLARVLKDWIDVHPGGQFLFCHSAEVRRSKKRSRTTGHQSGRGRAKTLVGRKATIALRPTATISALTKDEVHDHFKRALAEGAWSMVPGWHCFRHTFISLCASQGVDQRCIDEWVGHQTDEQRKRYRHLLPSVQHQAICSVFDGK